MYYLGLSYLIFLQLGQKVQVQNLKIPLEFQQGFSNIYYTFFVVLKIHDCCMTRKLLLFLETKKYIRTSKVRS
jgi:hypothetical protein